MKTKLMHITYHFEYSDQIEEILDSNQIQNFVRYSMIESKDLEGKHYGTKVYPGSAAVIQAQVPEDKLEQVMQALKDFKERKESHRHLQALVLPVEDYLD